MIPVHPLVIHNIQIPSNVFFAPINPGYSSNGQIQKGYSDFFVDHAGKEIGICYVGNVSVLKTGRTNNGTAVLSCTSDSEWESLTKRIRIAGSLPGIQLAFAPPQFSMQKTFTANNTDKVIKKYQSFYSNFDNEEKIAKEFITAAKKSYALGFDIVQIHAAHGYLLSLLLSRSISKSNNPMKTKGFAIISNIIDQLKTMNGILDIRLSLYEGIDDGLEELDYKLQLFELLIERGIDIISLSNGFYNIDKKMIYPPKDHTMHIYEEAKGFAEKESRVLWNVAGNMEYALTNDTTVPPNLSFSLGRQLLSDSQTISKMRNGRPDSIVPCSECNKCHYYSYDLPGIQNCEIV